MEMKLQINDIRHYLESNDIIDFEDSEGILHISRDICARAKNEAELIRESFEYVRDEISHSADIGGKVVTCKASEVLSAKEGICYAKSHLLAAILRANKIPAGFCYQKIILDDEVAPFLTLHGLNAVYVKSIDKWIRLDPRGNKPAVDAQFSLEKERLAFPVRAHKGESDVPVIYAFPDANVVDALTRYTRLEELWNNLPVALETEGIIVAENLSLRRP